MPDTELNVFAPAGLQRTVEDALTGQMQYSYFRVTLRDLRSRIHFTELEEGFLRLGDTMIETQYLNHTAPTISFRISSGGATVAYVTDHEPFWNSSGSQFKHPGDQRHIAFLNGADLVIHDAQYSLEEYPSKIGWGIARSTTRQKLRWQPVSSNWCCFIMIRCTMMPRSRGWKAWPGIW